jgi:restriction system protein
MASNADLLSSKKLVWPVMQALKRSSAPTQKSLIDAQLIEILGLSQDLIALRHDNSRAEYQYRSAWALSYGKKAGYFENPARNLWALTEKGRQIDSATDLVL